MKIKPAQADAFARAPAADIAAVLVYGPDAGLARERAGDMIRAIVEDASDPFRVTEMTGTELKSDPARLADEVAAIAMTGGRRVVYVREATDGLALIFAEFLKDPPCAPPEAALVIVEAGELAPRSAVRKLFENAGNAAALACYLDDPGQIQTVIRKSLGAEKITVSEDALEYLSGNLGGDRMVTRREIEKLALYAGKGGRVELADAIASVGDSSALAMDDVAFSAAGGETAALDRALERVFQEGQSAVGVVRGVMRHFDRLHQAALAVAAGDSEEAAMAGLRPAVFWKDKVRFRRQIRRWPGPRAADALTLLVETEILCKTTGLPDQAICRQALFDLARQETPRA